MVTTRQRALGCRTNKRLIRTMKILQVLELLKQVICCIIGQAGNHYDPQTADFPTARLSNYQSRLQIRHEENPCHALRQNVNQDEKPLDDRIDKALVAS